VSTEDTIKGVILAFACALLAAPAGFVYFIGWIVVIGFVHCPADAYECPF
jgi:hypothetical protein